MTDNEWADRAARGTVLVFSIGERFVAEFTPEIADDVVAACRASADEIVAALTRAFDGRLMGVTIGQPASYDAQQPPEGFDGAGLAVVLKFAEASAVALLPEACGLLPTWYREPDATGKSKLSTLAQELSMLLVPEAHVAEETHTAPLDLIAESLARAEVADAAALVPLTIRSNEKEGQLSLLWPVGKHRELLPKTSASAEAKSPAGNPPLTSAAAEESDPLSRLPRYARSFLKVQVPVSVNLASQKLTVEEIRELVPGAIIKFDKSCDEMLDLVVCERPIAAGEVVKVGDRFGLRIRNMIQPQEQFIAVKATVSP